MPGLQEYFNSLPHAEVDAKLRPVHDTDRYFNSLPHAEVDWIRNSSRTCWRISTHYLTQRQTNTMPTKTTRCTFQLTTSRRGRPVGVFTMPKTSTFQLTTSRRGRRITLISIVCSRYISTHYLTQRQTLSLRYMQLCHCHFNSLPHAEVDKSVRMTGGFVKISTHYLTQRQTMDSQEEDFIKSISTHYLTQRQTEIWRLWDFTVYISTHYLTQRQTDEMPFDENGCNISTHYLTQRQTEILRIRHYNRVISTHYLTQRQTSFGSSWNVFADISTHYLTQRQTKRSIRKEENDEYFNSLPHAEVDIAARPSRISSAYFNSLPHAEVDDGMLEPECRRCISTHYLTQRQTSLTTSQSFVLSFQLTTSRRGRRLLQLLQLQSREHFNSLPHAEVD